MLNCIVRNRTVFDICLMSRVFTNGPGERRSIPGRVIPKTQKWYLMLSCLTLVIIRYRSRVKWSNRGNGVPSSPTPWCSSYWKDLLKRSPVTKVTNFTFFLLWHLNCVHTRSWILSNRTVYMNKNWFGIK